MKRFYLFDRNGRGKFVLYNTCLGNKHNNIFFRCSTIKIIIWRFEDADILQCNLFLKNQSITVTINFERFRREKKTKDLIILIFNGGGGLVISSKIEQSIIFYFLHFLLILATSAASHACCLRL